MTAAGCPRASASASGVLACGRVLAKRELPDTSRLAIATAGGEARAEQECGGIKLAPRPRGNRELRRRRIDFPLCVQVQTLQEGGRLLIAGGQRFERSGTVPARARLGHRALQGRRPRRNRLEHAIEERRLQHGVAVERGDPRERRRDENGAALRRRRGLENERPHKNARKLLAPHDARPCDVAARRKRLGADDALRHAPGPADAFGSTGTETRPGVRIVGNSKFTATS